MLPWLLTLLALGIFVSVFRPSSGAVLSTVSAPGCYQSPDRDLALAKGLRPVQQYNLMDDGGLNKEYAWLGEDVGQGNPISWSNWPNAVAPYRPGQNSLCYNVQRQLSKPDGSEIVIQGHSVPLANELYMSRNEGDSIVPFGRMRASLLCCPSTYQTDQGCVCGL